MSLSSFTPSKLLFKIRSTNAYGDTLTLAHPVVNCKQFSDPPFGALHDVIQKQLEVCVDGETWGPVTFIPSNVICCPAAAGIDPHWQHDAAVKG